MNMIKRFVKGANSKIAVCQVRINELTNNLPLNCGVGSRWFVRFKESVDKIPYIQRDGSFSFSFHTFDNPFDFDKLAQENAWR